MIKTFEQYNTTPQLGDYVKIDSSKFEEEMKEFFDENFGKIMNVYESELKMPNFGGYPYEAKFDNDLPRSTYDYQIADKMAFNIKEILAWAKSIKELKIKLESNKYNL